MTVVAIATSARIITHDAGETRSGAQLQNRHSVQSRTVGLIEVVGEEHLGIPNDGPDVGDILNAFDGEAAR